jgi:Bacterial Ig-like domain (group 3)
MTHQGLLRFTDEIVPNQSGGRRFGMRSLISPSYRNVLWDTAAGLLSVVLLAAPVASAQNPVVVATVPVGNAPVQLTVNPTTNQVYVNGVTHRRAKSATGTPTTTTLSSSPNPSSFGQQVTFTAQVSAGSETPPDGEIVTLSSGSAVLGPGVLIGGAATLTTSLLPGGASSITASYPGDATFQGSTSAPLSQQVQVTGTAVNVTWAADPPLNETFTATVTGPNGTPTGSVTFNVGSTVLGTSTLSGGIATLIVAALTVGSNTVTANYSGDENNSPASAWTTQTFVMPYNATMYIQQEGGTGAATTEFGTGTWPTNFVEDYSGLPSNPDPPGQVLVGSFDAGTIVNFGMYTVFGSQIGWAFSDEVGSNQAALISYADTENSLGLNHSITQQTSSTTWVLWLDDALSYLYDDNNHDVIMEIILVPSNLAPTTTTLTSSLNPSNYGQPVTFTATVTSSSGTPTGTVIFYNGSTQIGSATLSNGSASLSTSYLPVGSDPITAAYQGSSSYAASASAVLNQVVNGITTATSLSSSLNPSTYGQLVTFAATVTSGSGPPTGTVIFYNGTTAIGSATLSSGSASTSTSSLPAGSNAITAAYQGSGGFAPSTSAVLTQVVSLANTTTALASSVDPVKVGQYVTYTATITGQYGGAVTGTLTFQDDGTTVATVGVSNNQAAFTTKYKEAGVQVVTATYSGDSNYQGSASSVFKEDVGKVPYESKTIVATSGSPSLYGEPVTFTVTVTSKDGAIPDGETVTFYANSKEIGTGATSGGLATFTTSSLAAKSYTIRATYSGDSTFKESSGKVTQVVTAYPTSTTLTSSLNPSTYGQTVTWTATVTSNGGPVPTGKVKFTGVGGAPKLNGSGVATLTKQWLNAATYSVVAEYVGDDASAPSDSATLDQVVNPAATATVVTSSPNPSSQGQSVTFTATVTTSTGVNSAGTVTFTAGGTTLGTATLSANVASISASTLPVGTTVVQATYNGETDFTGSSGKVTQTVNP